MFAVLLLAASLPSVTEVLLRRPCTTRNLGEVVKAVGLYAATDEHKLVCVRRDGRYLWVVYRGFEPTPVDQ